jgi:hypothetical protein
MMPQWIRHEYGGFANKVNEVGSLAPARGTLVRAGPPVFAENLQTLAIRFLIAAVSRQYRHIAICHTREAPKFRPCHVAANYYKNTQLSIRKLRPGEVPSSRRP